MAEGIGIGRGQGDRTSQAVVKNFGEFHHGRSPRKQENMKHTIPYHTMEPNTWAAPAAQSKQTTPSANIVTLLKEVDEQLAGFSLIFEVEPGYKTELEGIRTTRRHIHEALMDSSQSTAAA